MKTLEELWLGVKGGEIGLSKFEREVKNLMLDIVGEDSIFEIKLYEKSTTYGDTGYEANPVNFGRIELRQELKDKIERKYGRSELHDTVLGRCDRRRDKKASIRGETT